MARRRRSRKGSASHVDVTLDVPVGVTIPSVVYARPVDPGPPKVTRRVPVRKVHDTYKKRVRVYLARRAKMRSGVAMIKDGVLRIYSQRRVRRVLASEYNRRRNDYKESRKKRKSVGQIHSLRADRHGLMGAALRNDRTGRQLEYAAMVSRAIERS